jgi:hypothetical protein
MHFFPAAASQPVPHLVRRLGDGGLDLAAAQVSADRGAGVSLVAQHSPGPGPGPPRAPPRDLQLAHQRGEGQRIVALPGAGHLGQRPAPGIGQQVDLCWSARPGTGPAPPGFVTPLRPGGAPDRSAQPAPAVPGPHRRATRGAPRPRAGAPALPWHRPRPSTPGPRPNRIRRAAGPGSSPRSHPPTSGGAGYRPSSSSRTAPADPATGTPARTR